jgi:CRP-like cAMP-binding protein
MLGSNSGTGESIESALARLFPNVELGALTELSSSARRRYVLPGETVLWSEDMDGYPGVVLTGLLRTVIALRDGRRGTISYVRPGGFYGLPTVFFPVPLGVEVVRASTIIELHPATLDRIGNMFPRFAWFIARTLAGAILRVPNIIEDFGFKTVSKRVADHLLALSTREPASGALVAHVTHQALAAAVGSSREVVSRSLRKFEENRLITIGRASICILDEKALQMGAE